MGLTGRALLVLVAATTVLTVLGTLWIWPYLAVRSWPAMFARLGTVLLTQILLLSTLGLLANDYFAFYSSWSDLLGRSKDSVVVQLSHSGTGTGTGTGTGGGGGVRGAGVQQLGSDGVTAQGAFSRDPARVGRLERIRIPGPSSGLSSDGYVYLPPQYYRSAYKDARFPAIVAMTGFPGEARNLVTKLRYPATELRLIEDGAVRPAVLVLMRPSPTMPRDSECEDVPGGPQAGTYFVTDVPRDLRAAYRIAAGPGSLGIMGDSTGGYCAVKLGMEHPGVYSAAVSLSGYFAAAHDPTTGDLFAGNRHRRAEADLGWRLTHLPPPPVAVLLADSKQDGRTYADARAFAAAAHPPMTVDQAFVATGGHNFTTWVRLLPASLTWMSAHLTNPG
ncbi:alpha/beta hydrolase [Streptomyces sp. NRRL B-24484]|uniref:alpha/beta hydrolase n=1 Tax=Streptomyces sp. NRRL B-24484 TaxID=1463833 RepID=UPI0004BEC6B4|nr:alpha/beta hydrolase-fold protein [Streptomyces sp. NRRL B-24484]